MFEILLLIYLFPIMVIAMLLVKLAIWIVRNLFKFVLWLVRTLFVLLGRTDREKQNCTRQVMTGTVL